MNRPLIYPRGLAPGDTIGVTAPASPPESWEEIGQAFERLTQLGYHIRESKHLHARDGYLAGTDAERAGDLHDLFVDPEVKAIFALRGGYGSCRLLPRLDFELIRAHAKPFIGYSDITALHLAIFARAAMVTFHGANIREALEPFNAAAFAAALGPDTGKRMLFSGGETVVTGTARGRLLGGNMTCLLRLLATPYAPDFDGAILFLEDIGEKAYRIDGMFTHLRLAGVLDRIVGLVLGRFSHDVPEERTRIEECLRREARAIGKPCLMGAPIGHFPEQIVVPIGIEGTLQADEKQLTILG